MNRIRCFLAIKVKPVRRYFEYISKIEQDYNIRIKIVKPENYHFTLHFFGDIPIEDVKKVNEALQDLELQKFKFKLVGKGSFPKNKLSKTKVLFVDSGLGRNNIIKAATTIHEILGSLEFQIQTRKFIPHLTVCRIRSGEEITSFTQAWLHGDFEDIVMECNKLDFIKSTLTASSSVYSTLYEYKLN